jgi:hypothetical protein
MDENDPKLSALLREARATPSLPPHFQQNVWRRIESAEAPVTSGSWIDALATLILRPKFAFVTAAALLCAGVLLGAHQGSQTARRDAQARYIASVAPNSLR